nr:MAG TPA: hypothetical protein [Caudoviricetes sp.]
MTSLPNVVDLLGVPFFLPPVFLPIAMRLKLIHRHKDNNVNSPT